MPPGLEVAVYVKIDDPPSETGAVYETVALALPAVAGPMVGAPGTVAGRMKTPKANGLVPTVKVAITMLVAVSITETLPLTWLAT